MKKLFLMMGLATLFMVACNNAPKQPQEPQQEAVVEEHHCPFCPLKAEYANWDNMDETAKAELNKKAYDLFAQMDAEMEAKRAECEAKGEGEHKCNHEGEGHQCNHEGEHKCQHEMAEMTEEQKAECEAKCAEMKAKCEEMKAAWDAFETKTLDEQKDLVLGRIAAMGMGQCNHEGEGEGHQCQHGEGHNCENMPK